MDAGNVTAEINIHFYMCGCRHKAIFKRTKHGGNDDVVVVERSTKSCGYSGRSFLCFQNNFNTESKHIKLGLCISTYMARERGGRDSIEMWVL